MAENHYDELVKRAESAFDSENVGRALNPEQGENQGVELTEGKAGALQYLHSQGIAVNPAADREILNDQVSGRIMEHKAEAKKYFKQNLESILTGVPNGKLEKIVSSIPLVAPKNAEKKYAEAAARESAYMKVINMTSLYEQGKLDEDSKEELLLNLANVAANKSLKESKEKGFDKALASVLAYTNQQLVLRGSTKSANLKRAKELVGELEREFREGFKEGYGLADYARDKIRYLANEDKDEAKEMAIRAVYQASKIK